MNSHPANTSSCESRRIDELPSAGRSQLSAIDLFAGAGGFSLGLANAGFQVVGAFDNWSVAARTHARNFNHPVHVCDLSQTSGSELLGMIGMPAGSIDLVVGGPPCQGFSVQRIGADHDVRNHLILEFGRLITEISPRLFLMENVPGLLGKRGKELVEDFVALLAEAGYETSWMIVNAADYGVAQLRKRVVFAGWKIGMPPFKFPHSSFNSTNYRTVEDALNGLPSPPLDLSPHPGDSLHRRTKLSPLNQWRIKIIPPGGGMQDLPDDLKVDCHKVGAAKIGHRYVYGRLAPNKPSATITAHFDSFTRGKFGHPTDPRNITLREGARLQSFPDNFRFIGTQEEIAAQIGNAVPPLVSEVFARAAIEYLHITMAFPSVFHEQRSQLPLLI